MLHNTGHALNFKVFTESYITCKHTNPQHEKIPHNVQRHYLQSFQFWKRRKCFWFQIFNLIEMYISIKYKGYIM